MTKEQIEKKIKYYQRRRKNLQRKLKEYQEAISELNPDDEWVFRKEENRLHLCDGAQAVYSVPSSYRTRKVKSS